MHKYRMWLIIIIAFFGFSSSVLAAQQYENAEESTDSLMVLVLEDGTELEGYIISADPSTLTLLTPNDLQITVKISDIRSM
ncbi:MAG: hypothetical protein GF372_01270, partial [Candidatus Marinimicrobia bacterium]|nr:hypothetical protein [Candidatus Neomarinimicrobiota bacterium]